MKIIQRYFIVNLVWTTFISLTVLVAIFAFLSLIDQLEDAGQGNYGTYQAVIYVILTLPRLAYEIIPVAAMIGGMTSLALLARNSELDVIRLSGVSEYSLAGLMGKSALVIVLFSIFVGEFIVPASEKKARYQRSIALTEQVAMRTKYGFWARDGNSFINIRKILPGNVIEDIYIYEFDDEDRLRNSIFANNARYVEDKWVLEEVERTIFDGTGVRREQYPRAAWESWVNDDLINLVIINPLYMSLWNLSNSIRVLKSNSQNTATYEQAFYAKLIRAVHNHRHDCPFHTVGCRATPGRRFGAACFQRRINRRGFLLFELGIRPCRHRLRRQSIHQRGNSDPGAVPGFVLVVFPAKTSNVPENRSWNANRSSSNKAQRNPAPNVIKDTPARINLSVSPFQPG